MKVTKRFSWQRWTGYGWSDWREPSYEWLVISRSIPKNEERT